MNELQVTAKIVLANTFVMYFKAHSYHWNVVGPMFTVYHDFFGTLYQDLHAAVDATAEEIRALDEFAPINLAEMYAHRTILEDTSRPVSADQMLVNLQAANGSMIESLNALFKTATANNNQGLADFAAGRLDVHAKHGWMLKSLLS